MRTESNRRRVTPALLLALGGLAGALLSAHLIYLAHSEGCRPSLLACPVSDGQWQQPDTLGYVRLARQIRVHGLGSVTYEKRPPGYPLLLAGSLALTGAVTPVLWVTVVAGMLAVAALAWLAGYLTGRRSSAVAAGLLFCVWLPVYRYGPLLLTDALHAFLAAIALATAVAWRASHGAGWAAVSAFAWVAVQSLRATFFAVAPLLVLLLIERGASRRIRAVSASVCAATLLVPTFVVASNWLHHGLASPSVKLAYAAACESGPMLKARMGHGAFRNLRRDCQLRTNHLPPRERVAAQWAEAREVLGAHPGKTAAMLAGSVWRQMTVPLRPFHTEPFRQRYPGWLWVGSAGLVLFWLCGLGGLVLLWRQQRGLVLFLVGAAVMVLVPSSLVHTADARYRFVLDLLFVPVVVVFVDGVARRLRSRLQSSKGARPSSTAAKASVP